MDWLLRPPRPHSQKNRSCRRARRGFWTLHPARLEPDDFPVYRLVAAHAPDHPGGGHGLLGPTPYNGALALRRAIAAHLRQFRGMDVDPEQIIVGAGTGFL